MTILVTDPAIQHRLMHGFADLSRLRILALLRDGRRRVSDISARLELSRPNTSKHLACLLGCGLVEREKHGREVFYELADGVENLLSELDRLLDRVGDSVAACELTTAAMLSDRG